MGTKLRCWTGKKRLERMKTRRWYCCMLYGRVMDEDGWGYDGATGSEIGAG